MVSARRGRQGFRDDRTRRRRIKARSGGYGDPGPLRAAEAASRERHGGGAAFSERGCPSCTTPRGQRSDMLTCLGSLPAVSRSRTSSALLFGNPVRVFGRVAKQRGTNEYCQSDRCRQGNKD